MTEDRESPGVRPEGWEQWARMTELAQVGPGGRSCAHGSDPQYSAVSSGRPQSLSQSNQASAYFPFHARKKHMEYNENP